MSGPSITSVSDHLSLLRSIIDITRHPDRRAMEKGLIVALAKHVPCDRITLIPRPFSADAPMIALVELSVASFNTNPEDGWGFDLQVSQHLPLASAAFNSAQIQVNTSGDKQTACVPLTEAGQVSAVIAFDCPDTGAIPFETIDALLKIYQNYLNILRESESDKLTGLLNRRTFDGKFQHLVLQQSLQLLSNADESSQQRHHDREDRSWLGIIDIDHFKRINDQYGHIYGDEILLLLSRQMQSFFRRADLLFRFGGEEFVVLLEPTNKIGAEIALSRFVSQIANYEFPQVGKVTISVGFAPIYADSVSTDVFGRADQALYYAKEHGRNQVASYVELLADGKLNAMTTVESIDLF